MFLQKVSRERDDQRFEERGEQLLRLDWKSERRRWETEKAKSAPAGWEDAFELEEEGPIRSQSSMGFPAISQVSAMSVSEGPIDEEREAELQREREEREMDDLLALMDHGETQHSSRYGSDDEEYEGIFMELAGQQQSAKLRHEGQSEQHDFVMVSRDDEMDMSS